jgi:hypothetical protein
MRHYRRIPTPAHLRVINVRLKHKVPYPVGGFLGGGERTERSSRTSLVVHYMHDESERILYPLLRILEKFLSECSFLICSTFISLITDAWNVR